MFWSVACSLLRAGGFFCTLGVLYGGLGISTVNWSFWSNLFFQLLFFSIFGHQNLGSRSVFSLKCWIRIRIKWIRIQPTALPPHDLVWGIIQRKNKKTDVDIKNLETQKGVAMIFLQKFFLPETALKRVIIGRTTVRYSKPKKLLKILSDLWNWGRFRTALFLSLYGDRTLLLGAFSGGLL